MGFQDAAPDTPSDTVGTFFDSAPFDALLVLGRGIDERGLSETSKLRARMAVDLALIALPSVVVFSGGHSWVQELEDREPPKSEGAEMLAEARSYIAELGEGKFAGIRFLAEQTSTSKQLLGLPDRGGILGILTDEPHNREKRVDYLAKLVFPGTTVVVHDTVPNETTKAGDAEERLAALTTKVFMFGVRRGNSKAIMSRQRKLEKANALYRRFSDRKAAATQVLAS